MKYKIFYIGLNNETLILFGKNENFKVIGTNYFEYFDHLTINPFDYIFILIYKLHFKNKYINLKLFLFKVWNKIYFLSSNIYKNNRKYLWLILNNKIEIVDTENIDYFSSFISENEIDLIVINSWGIIPNEILNLPKYKTINIHPSLLPQYRGALPTLWSLKNNDKESALTYLVLNDFIDDGIIIGQHQFDIKESDNWYNLEQKVSLILRDTLISDILNYLSGNYKEINNKIEPSYTGFYYKYSKIDLINETSREIFNKVGLYPYVEPFFYCYISLLNKKIYIKKIFFYNKSKHKHIPGKIYLGYGFVLFYTKDGILKSRLFKDINFSSSIFIIFNKIIHKI